jgi:hypothetical protein
MVAWVLVALPKSVAVSVSVTVLTCSTIQSGTAASIGYAAAVFQVAFFTRKAIAVIHAARFTSEF